MRYVHLSLLAILASSTVAKAQAPEFTVHEWGTFTSLYGSDGQQLSSVYREEEKLPDFVYKLDGIGNNKSVRISGLENTEGGVYHVKTKLQNVTVKMETPVLYFYSDQAFEAQVKVSFTKGLIGQWYPQCSNKPDIRYSDLAGRSQTLEYVQLIGAVDFARSNNTAEWKVKVTAPGTPLSLIEKKGETNTWTAPRETDANVVNYGKEYEKYIFYRGLGNFAMPVKVSFTINGLLEVENTGTDELPYLFIYERKDDGSALVYWTGALKSGEKKEVHVDIATEANFSDKLAEFQQALVSAGLYDKEASAMLKTWEQSYFNHTGLRVFWIAPRSFTDQIIPLSISPAPKTIERVLVGRSEILKPAFEKKLVDEPDFLASFTKDRFYFAMVRRVSYLKSHAGAMDSMNLKAVNQSQSNADYEKRIKTEAINVHQQTPGRVCQVTIDHPQTEEASIYLTDMLGHRVLNLPQKNLSRTETYTQNLDISSLPGGVYLVCVDTRSQRYLKKIVLE